MILFLKLQWLFLSVLWWDSIQAFLVDWTKRVPQGVLVKQYFLTYTPDVGDPASNAVFPPSRTSLNIRATESATLYHVRISGLLEDGQRVLVHDEVIPTSPEKPVLEYLNVDTSSVTFAFLSPVKEGIEYYVEYGEMLNEDQVSYVETNRTALRIQGLAPDTLYKLRVYSIFHGAASNEALNRVFKTKGTAESLNKHRRPIKPIRYTLPTTTLSLYPQSSYYPDPPALNNGLLSIPHWPSAAPTQPPLAKAPIPQNNYSYSVWSPQVPTTTANALLNAPVVQSLLKWTQPTTTTTTAATKLGQIPVGIDENAIGGTGSLTPVDNDKMTSGGFVESADMTRAESGLTAMNKGQDRMESSSKDATQPEAPVNGSEKESKVTAQLIVDRPEDLGYVAEEKIETEGPENNKNSPNADDRINDSDMRGNEANNKYEEADNDNNNTVTWAETDENSVATAERAEKEKTEDNKENTTSAEENKADLDLAPEDEQIQVSREGQQVRLDWQVPESALCDNFLTNTTVLSLHRPKSVVVASPNHFQHIKLFAGHVVQVKVQCMLEGAVSGVWESTRTIDFRKPEPVKNLRVKDILTDEFYLASVVLDVDWPKHQSNKYEVVVSWGLGKQVRGTNKLTLGGQALLNVSSLEAATLYTFSVKNVSKELGIESSPTGIRQITPPIITSTLYPGQISSHAININFDESASEHKFDEYELHFSGSSKNITKKLGKTDPKTFTFNNLTPGRTYTFALYTVYKHVRSRAVIEEITTYPLKARKFYAIAGPGYVTLEWEVENIANNECQFRLEYASTSNKGVQKSQKVKLQDVNSYRFTGLQFDSYYTFTITVLMGKGKAMAESESEMITVGFKGKPNSFPTLKRQGSRELVLSFENDPRIFADTNGVVDNFALNDDTYELKSYYDVRDEEKWPSYRASHSDFNPFKKRGSSRTASFVVGEEDCDRRKLNEPFCNGVLRSHVEYYVKVRAYLVTNIAMETEWVTIKGIVDETTSDKGQRRLPCYMYLNGCNKSSASIDIRPSLILLFLFVLFTFSWTRF